MPEAIEITVPGSKSHTQRALLLAALAAGESELLQPLDCDDSRHLRLALRALGAGIDEAPARWRVTGGPLRAPSRPLWCGDAGSALRFLAPLALLVEGALTLDGSQRLRQRPLGDLIAALERLGVDARRGSTATLPIELRRRAPAARDVTIDASRSSQFVSGLLLVAPLLPAGLRLEVTGALVSRPYVELTLQTMRAFGAEARQIGRSYEVRPGAYAASRLAIEGDWSSAAFLLAAGWIAGRAVHIANVSESSSQGDRVIVGLLEELGRPRPHDVDLSDCPDLVAPLAAAAVFAAHATEIRGVAHARQKESDRLAVLVEGLRRAGASAAERADGLRVEPAAARLHAAVLDPRGDHRMAMAFGLLSLRQPGIRAADAGCVSKSFPGFWRELERLR
jgi:3-phosphoshikimate 1-carboxyvinyltransferase